MFYGKKEILKFSKYCTFVNENIEAGSLALCYNCAMPLKDNEREGEEKDFQKEFEFLDKLQQSRILLAKFNYPRSESKISEFKRNLTSCFTCCKLISKKKESSCVNCLKHFCLKHRFASAHNCSEQDNGKYDEKDRYLANKNSFKLRLKQIKNAAN